MYLTTSLSSNLRFRCNNNTNTIALPVDSVWTPQLSLVTPASSVMSIEASVSTVRYFADDTAFWIPNGLIKVPCSIDIKYYPFDSQTCTFLYFADNTYFSTDLKLHVFLKEVALSIYTENGVCDITKTEAAIREQIVSMYTLITIYIGSKATIYGYDCYHSDHGTEPCEYYGVFVTPFVTPDSGERISLSITLLLAQVVFLG